MFMVQTKIRKRLDFIETCRQSCKRWRSMEMMYSSWSAEFLIVPTMYERGVILIPRQHVINPVENEYSKSI